MSTKSLIKTNEMFPTVFEDFFKPWNEWFDNGGLWGKVMRMPAVNVTDNKDNFLVSVAAPGMKKNDFKIDINGDMLTISCEKEETREEKEKKYTRKEYNYSSFSRSFTLPDNVTRSKIEATYDDGVLHLRLPKSEESKKAAEIQRISVK
jgi:Molecular chaperone (small heat shock protein)